jgi:nicotinamide riboside kinase
MPAPQQAPARIGLVGGECTGKSTLARALADQLPACVVAEAARSFVERHGRTPRREEQAAIMAEQQALEDAAAATCPHGWVVADPAPLMTAVYSVLYFADDSLLAPAADLARGYDLVAWCDVDLPWQADDGQRDGPEHRAAADAILASAVDDLLRPRGIRVVRARGSLRERVDTVRRAWQPRGPVPPT